MKTYKTIESWTKAMQKDKEKKLWHDWFKIGGDWYTCEEYDESGKYMRFTSATAWKHIDIDTSNRYSENWLSDMVATVYTIDDIGFRFDISYYLDEDITKKQIKELQENLKRNGYEEQVSNLLDFVLNNK
jgi:hypothetical protein